MIILICQGDWILCTLTHSWQVISQVSNWDCLISALPWTSHWWACSVLTLSFKMRWTVDRALIWRRLLPHLKISICTGGSHQPPKEGCILAVTMKKGRLLVVTSLAYKSHLKERHALLAITWKHKFKCLYLALLPIIFLPKYPLISEESALKFSQSSLPQTWNSFEISCLMLKISRSFTEKYSHNSFDT